MNKIILISICIVISVFSVSAQNGGKAEANRLEIPRGKTSVTVTGTLKEGEQVEYVFSATEKQLAFVWINSINPKGKFYSFVVKGAENDFVSDLPRLEVEKFQVPATGDYLIYIMFRPIGKVKKGSYKLTLEIKN